MRKNLTPSQRVIVSVDLKPTDGRKAVAKRILEIADALADTGVYIKLNSAGRAMGYNVIAEIKNRGLGYFADLKLNDIGETVTTDGAFLSETPPDLVTIMCSSGVKTMQALRQSLPKTTEVLGVTVLTSLTDEDAQAIYGCSVLEGVKRFAFMAKIAGIDGIVSSAKEAAMVREIIGDEMTINTPAIRPKWHVVANDDQNPERVMTPEKAIKAGADRLVIGRPFMEAKDMREAVLHTINEIVW